MRLASQRKGVLSISNVKSSHLNSRSIYSLLGVHYDIHRYILVLCIINCFSFLFRPDVKIWSTWSCFRGWREAWEEGSAFNCSKVLHILTVELHYYKFNASFYVNLMIMVLLQNNSINLCYVGWSIFEPHHNLCCRIHIVKFGGLSTICLHFVAIIILVWNSVMRSITYIMEGIKKRKKLTTRIW